MDRIYNQARCTLLWLGGSEPIVSQRWIAIDEGLATIAEIQGIVENRLDKF